MLGIIRSELLKMRHTFSMKLVMIAPVITVVLGYLLSGNSVQFSAYNWWYSMILPIVVSMWSASIVIRERNTGMQNIVCLPVNLKKLWIGKVIALAILLLISNLIMWAITTIFGIFTNMNISPIDGLVGCLLLFVTYLWQFPFIMILTSNIGYMGGVLVSFAGNIFLSTLGAEKSWFIFDPYAISARIVCPFFKMRPNGLPLESGSVFLETGFVFPALLISVLFAVAFLWGYTRLLTRGDR